MDSRTDRIIKREIKHMSVITGIVLVVLMSILMFSPLALQISDNGTTRGGGSSWEIDSLMTARGYQQALSLADSMIADEEKDLPRLAFFDCYLSKEERYDAKLSRARIYDLQWKRIEILRAMNDTENLREALTDYQRIMGNNQKKAKALLNQIGRK